MYFNDNKNLSDNVIYSRIVPARNAKLVDLPMDLHTNIRESLKLSGIDKLYSHQAEAFSKMNSGSNIVITTPTASGKTLAFLLPVIQRIMKDPSTRAIFVYPTKALAKDQHRAISKILDKMRGLEVVCGVYDGDTPINERSKIRRNANIILTNPEMLNGAFLPNHSKNNFDFIFKNLRYVVLDELHMYKGAFGSHIANVLKRLTRICNYYNSSPQYMCSSATIANATELAENVCGVKFDCIDNDGSGASEKEYFLIQPPMNLKSKIPYSVSDVAKDLLPNLIFQNNNFIAFCKSRKAVEVILKEIREELWSDNAFYADMIASYRAGYTPLERKRIEDGMINGSIKGLLSTNALELGIDIGKLDTAVMVGFPGTNASFWQQAGRAGRAGNSAKIYMILDDLPNDQYIGIEPEWLFNSNSENAVIDKDNMFIQLAHVRSAAAELPLCLSDTKIFPDLAEMLPVLMKKNEVSAEQGKFLWTGPDYPCGDYSLRNMDNIRYKLLDITDRENEISITEMDELHAFIELHEGAIYMHHGDTYLVERLDIASHTARAKKLQVNYYTEPKRDTLIKKLAVINEKTEGKSAVSFCDINVLTTIDGHKRIQLHTRQNLGFDDIAPLSKSYDTEGLLIEIPSTVRDVFDYCLDRDDESDYTTMSMSGGGRVSRSARHKTYKEAVGYVLLNSAKMATMADRSDMSSEYMSDGISGKRYIVLYDMYVGGLGYSEKAYQLIDSIIGGAVKSIEKCKCESGCAVCVGDYAINKEYVLWALKSIYADIEVPKSISRKEYIKREETISEKICGLDDLENNWEKVAKELSKNGGDIQQFLSGISTVKVIEHDIYITVQNAFIADWANDNYTNKSIYNILKEYVIFPFKGKLSSEKFTPVKIKAISTNDDKKSYEKIAKRYKDLVEND